MGFYPFQNWNQFGRHGSQKEFEGETPIPKLFAAERVDTLEIAFVQFSGRVLLSILLGQRTGNPHDQLFDVFGGERHGEKKKRNQLSVYNGSFTARLTTKLRYHMKIEYRYLSDANALRQNIQNILTKPNSITACSHLDKKKPKMIRMCVFVCLCVRCHFEGHLTPAQDGPRPGKHAFQEPTFMYHREI